MTDNPGADQPRHEGGPTLDLSACETEQIHLLGHIQPHGCLLALDEATGRITHVSANIGAVLNREPDAILGRTLPEALDAALADRLAPLVEATGEQTPPATPLPLGDHDGPRGPCAATAHRHGGRVFIEIEPLSDTETPASSVAVAMPVQTDAGASGMLHALADRTVRLLAEETGYDRVMVYMFHPDWSGEVIAEARQPDMIPYLGLRYPATDIPPQARHLYTINLLRVIADVDAAPVPILAAPGIGPEGAEPPDLSQSVLRSVSPYHIEYLRNMEVAATLTASIIVDGVLWGMIACHHRIPRLAPPAVRDLVTRRTLELARHIEAEQRREAIRRAKALDLAIGRLERRLASGADPVSTLLFGGHRLADDLEAQGALVFADGVMALTGRCPPPAVIHRVLERAAAQADPVFTTEALGDLGGDSPGGVAQAAAGCAVLVLSRDPLAAIAVFRPSEARDVFWAGDPAKPAIQEADTGHISPRTSFAAWKEIVRDRSRPWEPWSRAFLLRTGDTLRRHLEAGGVSASLRHAVRALALQFADIQAQPGGPLESPEQGTVLTLREPGRDLRAIGANQTFLDLFDVEHGVIEDRDLGSLAQRLGLPNDLHDRALAAPFTSECWSRSMGRRTVEITARTVLAVHDTGATYEWDMLVFRDVTAFHRTTAALTAARDEAETASRQKSEFLANVSHELKTPLNAIIGFSELIRSGRIGPTSDRVIDYARIIGDAGNHLLAIINDLLDLSHIESGRLKLEHEPVEIVALTAECSAWMQSQPRGDCITWTQALADGPILVRGDRAALRRVVLNLLTNALKFTPDGGIVGVAVERQPEGGVVVTVHDTGIGIPADELEAIFQPFQRGQSAQVKRHDGVGLGLAMVKALAEAHGGRVSVTSQVGTGSTFRIHLPRDRVLADEDDARPA
ncbi:ATP-binding protein [uncultured Rhodospira sp.]|uniref:ATP-binding protein n=1 Tax=uncultured Rhodospira sp. TaxID=1936189 RepID=UPI002602978E|nr:ATP-binding protein [uncultured Rhodospira sp.]